MLRLVIKKKQTLSSNILKFFMKENMLNIVFKTPKVMLQISVSEVSVKSKQDI